MNTARTIVLRLVGDSREGEWITVSEGDELLLIAYVSEPRTLFDEDGSDVFPTVTEVELVPADEIERLQGIIDWLYERIVSESDQ